jgi:histidinol-phosphate aminotransferase
VADRGFLAEGARRLGLWVAESDANFVWLRLNRADEDAAQREAAVVTGLRERGVLVRAGGSLGRAGCLRVTVGTDAENRRFLEALAATCG